MKAEYRNVLNEGDESIRVSVLEDKEFPAAWHFHPQYELTYVISSSGMRYVGNSVHNFGPGDFVLVGANLPHSWKTVGKQNSPVKAVVIQWNEDLLGHDWMNTTEFVNIRKLLRISERGIRFPIETAGRLAANLCELPNLSPFERLLTLLKILQELALTKEYSLLSTSSTNFKISKEDSDRISIVQSYVKNNIHVKITVAEVADLIGLTEVSFCRYFKKVHNKTFITFLNEFRIAMACKSLIETEHTASEIAYQCGFNSISLFHRLFQRFMKQTPLDYRKSYRSIPF